MQEQPHIIVFYSIVNGQDMKIRIEGLERTVSYTKTSIEFAEFLVFHSNERCQYHDFYDLKMKEAANRSVSYVQTNSKAPESSDNDDNGPLVQRKLRLKKTLHLRKKQMFSWMCRMETMMWSC